MYVFMEWTGGSDLSKALDPVKCDKKRDGVSFTRRESRNHTVHGHVTEVYSGEADCFGLSTRIGIRPELSTQNH